MQVQTVRFFKDSFQCMTLSDLCRFRNRAVRPFICSALVKTIPNNLRKHRTQGAVSNLVSSGDAGLPWVLALQRRWCWWEADAKLPFLSFWLHWVLVAAWASSSCSGWGLLSVVLHGLLTEVPSPVAEHRL